MVSVIIPLYNKESLIGKTINTVLNQTYQDFEIVVVNDGSTDNSVVEVEKFQDSRIRIINQKNAGVSAARNRGIQEAKGDYIALLDGDDEWKSDYLQTQYELTLKYPECEVFAVNYELHDINSGKVSNTIIHKLPFEGIDGILNNYFEVASCSHPPICSISIMARNGVFESIGGFPLGIRSGEDLLTWARLACLYKIAYCKTPLAIFNVEGYDTTEKPKRIPAEVDVVGQELKNLYKTYIAPGLKQYVGLWHKMRSSIYMRLRMRGKSIREALYGLKYSPTNIKLYAFILLNLLPKKLQPF
jgi:glycosyltransferase involved in cell wall biosynthesis